MKGISRRTRLCAAVAVTGVAVMAGSGVAQAQSEGRQRTGDGIPSGQMGTQMFNFGSYISNGGAPAAASSITGVSTGCQNGNTPSQAVCARERLEGLFRMFQRRGTTNIELFSHTGFPAATVNTTLNQAAAAGATAVRLTNTANYLAGDTLRINTGTNLESVTIASIITPAPAPGSTDPNVTLTAPLARATRRASVSATSTSAASRSIATDGSWRCAVIGTFIAGVIALSLVVVTGYAGQVSLAQLALAGAWRSCSAGSPRAGVSPSRSRRCSPRLAAAVVGVVIGLPALRLRGLTLGVVTLAFAYAIEAVWFRNTEIVEHLRRQGGAAGALRGRPRHRHRESPSPASSSDCSACSRSWWWRCGVARCARARWARPCSPSGPTNARPRRRRQRRPGQGHSASPSPPSSPASAAASWPTAGASSPSTRSPRSAGWPCCPPRTWPASRRSGEAPRRASWPRPASCSSPSTSGSTWASGSRSSAASC